MKNKYMLLVGIISLIMILFTSACIEDYEIPEYDSVNYREYSEAASEKEYDDMIVHFLDVGQGDCAIIELPEDKLMLIDAGDNGKEDIITEYLDDIDADRIDYLVATHPHADHIGGMEEIIDRYDIGEIYMPKAEASSRTFEYMLDAVAEKELMINTAYEGKVIFDYDNVRAEIISPLKDEEYENLNKYSVVIKLVHGEKSFLFTGDAESENEKDILRNYSELKSDVLKVSHHGSSKSSIYQFLAEVDPEYAIISCGEGNEYGHPHRETMSRLGKTDAEVLRTDKMGTIIIKSDGKNLEIEE